MSGPQSLSADLEPSAPACPPGGCAASFSVTVRSGTNMPGGTWVDGKYYAEPVTFSWPGGSVHNITAVAGASQPLVRTSFSDWAGVASSESPTLMLIVNESGVLTAEYQKLYLVTLHFVDTAGAPVVPQSVSLMGPSGREPVGDNMSAWVLPNVSYSLSSAMWMGWNVAMSNDSTFTAAQPSSIEFTLGVYPQEIRVTDAYGLPLQGAAVNVTTLNGRTLALVTDAQGQAAFRVPVGLFSAAVSYFGVDDHLASASEGSHAFTVSFLLSYPLVATVAAMFSGAITFIYLMRRRRPTGGLRYLSD